MKKLITSLTLLVALLTASTVRAENGILAGDGSCLNPFIISDIEDWNYFTTLLNDPIYAQYYANKHYKLGADIGYYHSALDNQFATTTAAENPEHPFCGTFNGNGHTIWIKWEHTAQNFTPDPNVDSSQGKALFHYAGNGCNIHDLTVRGNVWTSFKYTAGFISYIKDADNVRKCISLSRCRSCITIMSYVNGDACSAGLVGYSDNYVHLNIIDCLYDGTISSGQGTHFCGMVGWQAPYGVTYIENSYVSPYNVYINSGDDSSYTFCAYDESINYADPCFQYLNNYFSYPIGKTQGIFMSSIMSPEGVAAMLGYWKVVGDQPLPITLADVSTDCLLFSGFDAYDFHIPYNNLGNEGDNGYRMLVDGDRSTSWRISYPPSWSEHWVPVYVDFSCDRRFIPKGYILTSGNNAYLDPDTRPKSWNLYGYSELYNSWILLDSRDAGANASDGVRKVDMVDKLYQFKDNLLVCQKFRLEITDICRPETIHDGLFNWIPNPIDYVLELNEIKIFGILQGQDLFQINNCSVGGLMPCYAYTGDPIAVNYIVTNHNGDKLIKNFHYTDSLVRRYGDITETVTEVRESGEYELFLKGMGVYSGITSRHFVVGTTGLPMPMIYEKDQEIDETFYYCVKMLNSGQIDLDLSETDPDFVNPFYVFDDGGKYGTYSSYCDSKLLIKAPEGYLLQVSGDLDVNSVYPNDYMALYDGNSETSPALGGQYHDGGPISTMVTSGQYLLIYFKSGSNSYANGLNLYVRPVSATERHNINLSHAEHGHITSTPANNATISTGVTLSINPDDGYLMQDLALTAGEAPVHYDGGLWYSGSPYEASFNMPADDVTVTPTFEPTYALSVNMPSQVSSPSEAMKVFIPQNVNVFKVHSPSSVKSYTSTYMLLVAPEGRMLQISGRIDDLDSDQLEVYNGNGMDQMLGYADENHKDLGMLVSTSNEMLLKFSSELYGYQGEFEITVNVIDHLTDDYNVILANPPMGGTVSINNSTDPTTAHVWDTVTLSIAPDEGYLLKDLMVSQTAGGNTYPVSVNGGLWFDTDPTTAWFVMPANDVTVTPYFTNELNADGGLYVNMPAHSSFDSRRIVIVPDHVTSFKVYDDGGKDGNHSKYCGSYLELRVPSGYRIKLTGTVTCSNFTNDYLKVCEGYESPFTTIGRLEGYGTPEGENVELMSYGNNMILHFHSESGDSYAGLDLLVELDDGVYPYTVTYNNLNPLPGCYVMANHDTFHVNDTVSLYVNNDSDCLLQELSVADANGNEIPLSQGLLWYDGNNTSATFVMPGSDVTINYKFVEKGNQYIKMPRKNTVDTPMEASFPEGITSCKIYDDGGADGHYSDYCNGYLLLTAPEGKVWQLTGIVKSEKHNDFLVPYEGDTDAKPIDYYMYGSQIGEGEDIGGLVTFGNQMLVRFYSDFLVNDDGLDLTATIIDPITTTIEGYANAPAGESRWAFISAPVKYYTLPKNVVNLIPETNGIPDPTSTHYDLYGFNQSAELEWENYKSRINSFSLDAGHAYLYANMYTQTLQFGGAINIEDSNTVALDYDANAAAKGWNLVGNPLTTAAFVDKPYYRMDEFGSNIEPVEHYRLLRVPACTGIMVRAEGEGESITFSKTIQPFTHNGSLHIAVHGQDAARAGFTVHDKAIVSFNEGVRLAKYVFNKDNAKLYIQREDSEFAIDFSEKQGEVPLGFKAVEDGEYTLTITPENVEANYLHLIDNKTGADIDLLTTFEYTFNATTTDNESRFRLVFNAHGLPEVTETAPTFAYYANGEIRLLVETEGNATLQVIDMTGRMIRCTDVKRDVSTSGMTAGVYVLRLIDGDTIRTQKIVIQ